MADNLITSSSKSYVQNFILSIDLLRSDIHNQIEKSKSWTYRTILQDLKIRLTEAKKQWAEEFYSVLWAYRTIYQISIGETLFKLTFETEAVIPIEIDLPSERIRNFYEAINSDRLRIDLDLLKETREQAHIRIMPISKELLSIIMLR